MIYRLQLKDHIISTYSSIDDKIKELIQFLKIGIENNETTLLLLSIDIQESYLQSQMALHGLDMSKLQNNGLLIMDLGEDWYLSFDHKDKKKIATIDNEKVIENWNNLIKQSIDNGRKGLRMFSMLDVSLNIILIDELIDYECVCSPKYNKPLLGLCL